MHVNRLEADLCDLLERCRKALLDSDPVPVMYDDLIDLRKNQLPDSIRNSDINIYAIWTRQNDSAGWRVQYIGQRSSRHGWSRVQQHLFHKPAGTQSKLDLVRDAIASGLQIGITGILVEPDFLRLSIEDELIRRETRQKGALPWNRRSRSKPKRNI